MCSDAQKTRARFKGVMKTKLKEYTKYECAKCNNEFTDYWYNHYQFNEGSFVTCTACNTKLVINFDFRAAVKLSRICLILFAVFLLLYLISILFWNFKSVGIYVLTVGCIVLLPLFYLTDYIRAPELFPLVKKTTELDSKNDS